MDWNSKDRQVITKNVINELHLDEVTLEDGIKHLQELYAKYPTGKIGYDYCEDGYHLELFEKRLETDEECQQRLKDNAVSIEKQKQNDLEAYKYLKEKLGLN